MTSKTNTTPSFWKKVISALKPNPTEPSPGKTEAGQRLDTSPASTPTLAAAAPPLPNSSASSTENAPKLEQSGTPTSPLKDCASPPENTQPSIQSILSSFAPNVSALSGSNNSDSPAFENTRMGEFISAALHRKDGAQMSAAVAASVILNIDLIRQLMVSRGDKLLASRLNMAVEGIIIFISRNNPGLMSIPPGAKYSPLQNAIQLLSADTVDILNRTQK